MCVFIFLVMSVLWITHEGTCQYVKLCPHSVCFLWRDSQGWDYWVKGMNIAKAPNTYRQLALRRSTSGRSYQQSSSACSRHALATTACVLSHSVISGSLWPHALLPARLLCLWTLPGKNTRVGCHFLLEGAFSTQGSNLLLLSLLCCKRVLHHWAIRGSPLPPLSMTI